jgi:hypothetical protein
MSWNQIRTLPEFRGRWVALDGCVYDGQSPDPADAEVIDSDEDLSELCVRIEAASRRNCEIRFCETSSPN